MIELCAYKRCSGVKGVMKKAESMFKCKRCINAVINREAETGLNDGIERVESFVYLGKLNAGGGYLSVVTIVWDA